MPITIKRGLVRYRDHDGNYKEVAAVGQDAYVYIRYSAVEPTSDSDMKATPDAWIGFFTGHTNQAPAHYTDYEWYRIKGDQGIQGHGVPTGGSANYVLAKASGDDYDTVWADISGFYTKPQQGIPYSDLSSTVQTSLGKADTAYQLPVGGVPSTDLASDQRLPTTEPSSVGNYFLKAIASRVGNAINVVKSWEEVVNASRKTRNLWLWGDQTTSDNMATLVTETASIPAGTYTLSAWIDRPTGSGSANVTLYNGTTSVLAFSMPVHYDNLNSRVINRTFATFTTTSAVDTITISALVSGNADSAWTDIQLEAGSHPTEYVLPVTADDGVAQNDIEKIKDVTDRVYGMVRCTDTAIETFSAEGIDPNTGASVFSTGSVKFLSTGYIPVNGPARVVFGNTNYRLVIWGYPYTQMNGMQAFVQYGTDPEYLIVPRGLTKFFRIEFRKIDNSALTTDPDDPTSDVSIIKGALKVYVGTDTSLSVAGTSADAKAVGDTFAEKADKVSSPTSGNFAALDASGNLTDSGSKASDFLTSHQDISGKADKTDTVLATTLSRGRKANTTVGEGSIAFGSDVEASDGYAVALGQGTIANHALQYVFGRHNVQDPSTNPAGSVGTYAEIVGCGTSSSKKNARALDWLGNEYLRGKLYVECDNSSANGSEVAKVNNPSFTNSVSMNRAQNSTVGTNSAAFGSDVIASGNQSFAEGTGGTFTVTVKSVDPQDDITIIETDETYTSGATGSSAHSEGYKTHAAGNWGAHSEGNQTVALGAYSHAEGFNTIAGASYAHAEGNRSQAANSASHAEGSWTFAYGGGSHAEGTGCIVYGDAAHAEGLYCVAVMEATHAEGAFTIANTSYLHACGSCNTEAPSYNEWVPNTHYVPGNRVVRDYIGWECVTENTDSRFTRSNWKQLPAEGPWALVIGNGVDQDHRSNAAMVTWDGDILLAGKAFVGVNSDGTGGTRLATVNDIPEGLPSYSSANEGYVLKIVNGTPTWVAS